MKQQIAIYILLVALGAWNGVLTIQQHINNQKLKDVEQALIGLVLIIDENKAKTPAPEPFEEDEDMKKLELHVLNLEVKIHDLHKKIDSLERDIRLNILYNR